MLWATSITVLLILATVMIHYEILRATSDRVARLSVAPRARVLVVIFAVLGAHVLEIGLYALAYYLMQDRMGIGGIVGETDGTMVDFLYFSITTYTTLGVGDLYPLGATRLVAGSESLIGLVLIGWSASFTFLEMQKFWEQHRIAAMQ
jgi:hypothetical protein